MKKHVFLKIILLHAAGSAFFFLLGLHLQGFWQGICMTVSLFTALHLLKAVGDRLGAPESTRHADNRASRMKKPRQPAEKKECALCRTAIYSLQWKIGENYYCRRCYDTVRRRIEEERLERGISVTFVVPPFMQNVRDTYGRESFPEESLRFFEGAERLDCGSCYLDLINAWDRLCPRKDAEETWALFSRKSGVIICRHASGPYEAVSSISFDPGKDMEETNQTWSACPLINPSGSIPGTKRGEWTFDERWQFDETFRLTCQAHWLTVSAGWHYSDYGTGNMMGHCFGGFSAILPAGLFTSREEALDFLARCPGAYAWPYGPARTRMEEGGFLL